MMEDTVLIFKGKITKEDGSAFDLKEFYEAMSATGFTFSGARYIYDKEEVMLKKQQILDSLTDEVMDVMVHKLIERLSPNELVSPIEFFENEVENPLHYSIFAEFLPEETKHVFRRMASHWVEFSVELEAELGKLVADYVKRTYKVETCLRPLDK